MVTQERRYNARAGTALLSYVGGASTHNEVDKSRFHCSSLVSAIALLGMSSAVYLMGEAMATALLHLQNKLSTQPAAVPPVVRPRRRRRHRHAHSPPPPPVDDGTAAEPLQPPPPLTPQLALTLTGFGLGVGPLSRSSTNQRAGFFTDGVGGGDDTDDDRDNGRNEVRRHRHRAQA